MGAKISTFYQIGRRVLLRYNVAERTEKFLNKGNLPPAPRHPMKTDKLKILKERRHSREDFEDLYTKNPQLDEYLKKVYLTSKTEEKVVESKRSLPKKIPWDWHLLSEPQKASPGHCTLNNIYQMMTNHKLDPQRWSVTALASEHKLEKKDIIGILTYYSLFKKETFKSMNVVPKEDPNELKPIEFEVYTSLVKKPVKQIESK